MQPRLRSATDFQRFEGFVRAIFSSRSRDEFRTHLSHATIPIPYRVRMKVLYSPEPLRDILKRLVTRGRLDRIDADNNLAFRVFPEDSITHGANWIPLAFLSTEERDVCVLVTVSTNVQWQEVLKAARGGYPRLVPIFLSQRELLQAVRTLKDKTPGLVLRVREISAREALPGVSRKSARSIREWTDEELNDALAHIRDRRQVLNSLTLAFYRQVHQELDFTPAVLCKTTKRGEIEVTGEFDVAWETIVSHISAVGQRKLTFFSNRGLRERAYKAAPLQVVFPRQAFSETAEVRRFVELLSNYPHSMHSVQHGNPYAHLRISDTFDGSAFDVLAIRGDAVTILPRLRATEAAIERLVHYIYENFGEGEVRELGSSARPD